MTEHQASGPEFSRPVAIAKIPTAGSTYRITANEAERTALAKRFGLVSVSRVEAEVRLSRSAGDYRLEADLAAEIVQSCIVTLEPVPEQIEESFTLCYRPGIDEDEADRLALENPEDEIIEPLIGESIDIGEAVAQQLSVALDPYPRVSGAQSADAEIDDTGEAAEASIERSSPFDALAALKRQP